MKKFFIFFMLLFFNILQSSENSLEFNAAINYLSAQLPAITSRIEKTMDQATAEEWQLLANYIVLSLVRARVELILQMTFIQYLEMTWNIYKKNRTSCQSSVEDFEPLHHSIDQLISLINEKNEIVELHTIAMNTLEDCAYPQPRQAMIIMGQDTTNFINHCCKNNSEHIYNTVANFSIDTEKIASYLTLIANTARALHSTAFIKDLNEGEQETATLTYVQNLFPEILTQLEKLHETSSPLTKTIQSVQEAGLFIFYSYYNAVYNLMKQKNFDTRYFNFMIDDKGIIEPSLRTKPLPEPALNS